MIKGKYGLVKELEDIVISLVTGIEYLNSNRRILNKYFNVKSDSGYYFSRQFYKFKNKFNFINGKRKWKNYLILEEIIIGLPYLLISTVVKLKLIEGAKEVFKEHEWKVIQKIIDTLYNFLLENVYSSEHDNLFTVIDQLIKNEIQIRDSNIEPMGLYRNNSKAYMYNNYNHYLDLSSISFQLEGIGNELEDLFPEFQTNICRKILEILCNDSYREKCLHVYFDFIFKDPEKEGLK